METLKQGYVTKTNKRKGAAIKHINWLPKAGGINKWNREWCNTLMQHSNTMHSKSI